MVVNTQWTRRMREAGKQGGYSITCTHCRIFPPQVPVENKGQKKKGKKEVFLDKYEPDEQAGLEAEMERLAAAMDDELAADEEDGKSGLCSNMSSEEEGQHAGARGQQDQHDMNLDAISVVSRFMSC